MVPKTGTWRRVSSVGSAQEPRGECGLLAGHCWERSPPCGLRGTQPPGQSTQTRKRPSVTLQEMPPHCSSTSDPCWSSPLPNPTGTRGHGCFRVIPSGSRWGRVGSDSAPWLQGKVSPAPRLVGTHLPGTRSWTPLGEGLAPRERAVPEHGPRAAGLSPYISPLVLCVSHVTAARPPGPMVSADGRTWGGSARGRQFAQNLPPVPGRSGLQRGPVVSRGRRSVLGCHMGRRHTSPPQQRKGRALCTETRGLRVPSVRLLQGRPPDHDGPGRGPGSAGRAPGPPRSLGWGQGRTGAWRWAPGRQAGVPAQRRPLRPGARAGL